MKTSNDNKEWDGSYPIPPDLPPRQRARFLLETADASAVLQERLQAHGRAAVARPSTLKGPTMKEVPSPLQPPVLPPDDGSHHPIRPVSALEAELAASGAMVVVRFRDSDNQRDLAFALSPPAAKQLAELLEQAVDEYLHSAPLPTMELPAGMSLSDLQTE